MLTKRMEDMNFKAPSMMFYEERLRSFDMWPFQIQPDKFLMSSAGFFYTDRNDTVECFSCALRLHQWKKEDDPLKEHRSHSPHCLFLKMIGQSKVKLFTSDRVWNPWKTFDPPSSVQYGCFQCDGVDEVD